MRVTDDRRLSPISRYSCPLHSRDLRRDVVTHELFHIFGLKDIAVHNTSDGLNNATTVAQIVAFLTDRFRQLNSDGEARCWWRSQLQRRR